MVAYIEEVFGMINLPGESLLCQRSVTILFWGCMSYGIYIDPWMVQCTIQVIHVVPMMFFILAYSVLLTFSLVNLAV